MPPSAPLRVLLTGFEPFGEHAVNPSALVAETLAADPPAGVALRVAVLPTSFDRAAAALDRLLDAEPFDVVLALGLAGNRSGFTVERVAINLRDARIADNDGDRPIDRPCIPDAPAARFATLPVKRMVAAIRAAGLEASLSHTAGTFVCNHVMFVALHRTAPGDAVRAGFIHLPFLPDQAPAGAPALPLGAQVAGIDAALRCVAGPGGLDADAAIAEGALW